VVVSGEAMCGTGTSWTPARRCPIKRDAVIVAAANRVNTPTVNPWLTTESPRR